MPHEESRKIIIVGNSLAITIPKPWAQYFHLARGDVVRIVSNGSIIIELPKKKETEAATATATTATVTN
jgi:antitoxin component of MazEF toxin-antitoxin module